MRSPVRPHGFRFLLLLACALLGACGARLRPAAGLRGGTLRLDTERVGQMRQAALLREAGGLAVSASSRTVVASQLALLAPTLVSLFAHDESELERLEKALLECVQRAERDLNAERWGAQPPTAAECREVIAVDP